MPGRSVTTCVCRLRGNVSRKRAELGTYELAAEAHQRAAPGHAAWSGAASVGETCGDPIRMASHRTDDTRRGVKTEVPGVEILVSSLRLWLSGQDREDEKKCDKITTATQRMYNVYTSTCQNEKV